MIRFRATRDNLWPGKYEGLVLGPVLCGPLRRSWTGLKRSLVVPPLLRCLEDQDWTEDQDQC